MYLARFHDGRVEFATAAFQWPASDSLVPRPWRKRLLVPQGLDAAIRVTTSKTGARLLLLLSADSHSDRVLQGECEKLLELHRPPGLAMPNDADEFDEMVAKLPPARLRATSDGYAHSGQPLACDFRLYPFAMASETGPAAVYQLHLAQHRPDRETERSARKYLAWLKVQEPFTRPVRALQRALVNRLLQPGFQAFEFLAVDDDDARAHLMKRIEESFQQTTGRIGFQDVPLEAGDFSDWMISGRHPARDPTIAATLPSRGASMISERETELVLSSKLWVDVSGSKAECRARAADVFISYSSTDFSYAASTCNSLEEAGVLCWIAPRDIDRDLLPYPEAIVRAIEEARALVVLVSDSANASVHIPREVDLALERRLPIVPILLQDVRPAGQLKYLLKTLQRLDAYNRDFGDVIQELLGRLGGLG